MDDGAGRDGRDQGGWGRWPAWPFVFLIRVYQVTLGPLMGGNCRFVPSCSHYGLEAYRTYGPLRGTLLTARRLLRCHPFGGGGYDPVPLPPEEGNRAAEHTGEKR